jgi:diguanylate cyclase (GGDEF)-like protein
MVRESDLAARYGEDRLAIIMPETGHDGAAEFSQRLSRAIEETAVDGNGGGIKVSVSIGLASLPADDVATAPDLVEKAARALEQAKEHRSGGVTG